MSNLECALIVTNGIFVVALFFYRVSVDKRRQIFVRIADLEVALKTNGGVK